MKTHGERVCEQIFYTVHQWTTQRVVHLIRSLHVWGVVTITKFCIQYEICNLKIITKFCIQYEIRNLKITSWDHMGHYILFGNFNCKPPGTERKIFT